VARRRETSQALALRSRIVLACAEGGSITAVAADLGVTRDTVRKWAVAVLRGAAGGAGR
jgi:transposase-like protein